MSDYPITTADWFLFNLNDAEATLRWLSGLGLRDPEQGLRDLRNLGRRGRSEALLARLAEQFQAFLPKCPDPGMALTNLDRFIAECPRPRRA